jgi:predicted metal-dependent hydrolase
MEELRAMPERGAVAFEGATIDYTVIRSRRRRKTIEITLDHQDGVLIAVPWKTPRAHIADMVHRQAAWIVRNGNGSVNRSSRMQFVSGEVVPYLGKRATLLVESGEAMRASVTFSHWALKVVYPIGLAGEDRRSAILRALEGWYRHRAAARLAERVNHWAHAGGREPQRVLIRGQRRRWGSCSADGTLRFNWRIVQLEPSLIDYVVVHELAHLRHRNHSARFWAEVARVLPDYRLRRRLLKDAGPAIAL